MKILFIVGTLQAGGLERFVTNLSIYLKTNTEYEPYICCIINKSGQFIDILKKYDIKILGIYHKYRIKFGMNFICQLFNVCKILKPDIIHSQVNFSQLQQVISFKLAGKSKIFFTERNCYCPDTKLRRMYWIIRFFLIRNVIDNYTANSTFVAKHLSTLLKAELNTIPVTFNGVDINRFTLINNELKNKIKKRLYGNSAYIIIGIVGRLHKVKDHKLAIDVIDELVKMYVNIRLVILGKGEERIDIEEYIRSKNISHYIIFLDERGDVEYILKSFDILILTSKREGMPNVVLEAMATGIPVIATDVGGIRDLVEIGSSGYIVQNRNHKDFCNYIIKLIDNNNLRRSMGRNGRKRIENRFTIEKCAKKYLKLYEK